MVSVIVPVYNSEKWLKRCIDSIISQTYSDLEIILVDDGSTDGSPKICDQYECKESRVKVIHQKNGGVSSARNAGLDVAQGKYIGFVDSDDWIHPQYFEFLMKAIDESETDAATLNNIYVSEQKQTEVKDYSKIGKRIFDRDTIRNVFFFLLFLPKYRDVLTCGLYGIYHKKCFEKVRFLAGCGYGEDIEMILKLNYDINGVIHLYTQLYYYYTGNESAMRSPLNANKLTYFKAIDEMCKFARISVDRDQSLKFEYKFIYEFFDLEFRASLSGKQEIIVEAEKYYYVFQRHFLDFLRNKYVSLLERAMIVTFFLRASIWKWLFGKVEGRMLETISRLLNSE